MNRRLQTAVLMTAREVIRNRTAAALSLILPLLFYFLVVLTTSDRIVVFQLASLSQEPDLEAPARFEALIFMALIAVGFISAFLGVNLIQKQAAVNRRLVFCGYRPSELAISKMLVLVGTMLVLSIYSLSALSLLFVPQRPLTVLAGLVVVGYVYGCYVLLIGALWRRELESIFSVILLTNVDVGWLQNPIFYTEAEHKAIVHWLPAYFPVQVAMTGAFTDSAVVSCLLASVAYGTAFLLVALALFWNKVRLTSPRIGCDWRE